MSTTATRSPVRSPAGSPAGTAEISGCCSPIVRDVLSAADAETLASTLKAVADPARLRLLSLIAAHQGGEACVCDLTEPVGLTQPTVSHHLNVLVDAGLLTRFAARGFDAVSVKDIAQLAEVGRTTFFRHFGDKQEVVFAREQELLDLIATEQVDAPDTSQQSATGALRALEPVVLRLCARMTADLEGYRRHLQLVDQHVELRARDATKMLVVAQQLGELLVAHGWATPTAIFAGDIALACYWTARHTSTEPAGLVEATRAAFGQALQLGMDRRSDASSTRACLLSR